MSHRLIAKKFAFWAAVAGVAALTNLGLEVLADKTDIPGLQRFVRYSHKGNG